MVDVVQFDSMQFVVSGRRTTFHFDCKYYQHVYSLIDYSPKNQDVWEVMEALPIPSRSLLHSYHLP